MCSPELLVASGTALNVQQTLEQGDRAKDIADINATVARQRAEDERARGRVQERRFRGQVGDLIGRQIAGFGGQNVILDGTSAERVIGDTAFVGELDALEIRNNAALRAMGLEFEAEQFEFQGDLAKRQSRIDAFSGLLTGAFLTSQAGPKVPTAQAGPGAGFTNAFTGSAVNAGAGGTDLFTGLGVP